MRTVHLCIFLSATVSLTFGAHELFGHSHESHHHAPSVQRVHSNVLSRLEEAGVPTPYHFQYAVDVNDGSHSRDEAGDASGRVTGSYTIRLADGRARTVTYTADEGGYRASVTTNERGTESQNPADVTVSSSAPTGKEAALSYTATNAHPPAANHRHEDHHHQGSPIPTRFTLGKF